MVVLLLDPLVAVGLHVSNAMTEATLAQGAVAAHVSFFATMTALDVWTRGKGVCVAIWVVARGPVTRPIKALFTFVPRVVAVFASWRLDDTVARYVSRAPAPLTRGHCQHRARSATVTFLLADRTRLLWTAKGMVATQLTLGACNLGTVKDCVAFVPLRGTRAIHARIFMMTLHATQRTRHNFGCLEKKFQLTLR
jgi:hypothetical protein